MRNEKVADDELAARVARARAGLASTAERAAILAEVDDLFASHHDRVYAVCLRFVGNPERARELTQDALFVAYNKLDQYRGDKAHFVAWVYGIARNLCLNAVRKRKETLFEDGLFEVADPVATVLSALRRRERIALVQDAAAAVLDESEQEAVYLRYVEQVSQDRIGEILGLESASGGRGLLQRCRRKLARELRRRLEDLGHGTSFIRESGP